MKKFTTLTSKAIPLPLKDVDTDMIIPAQFLTRINKSGYGECLFRRLQDSDPDFPLNQKKYVDHHILIARDNFGCGSSREHAVWALMDYGIRVVIAPNFADIFKSNSGKNGLILIEQPSNLIEEWLMHAQTGDFEMKVDLKNQKIITSQNEYHFDFEPFRKECILKGLDDMAYIMEHEKEVEAYNKKGS